MSDNRDVIPLSRFHGALTRPRGKQRLDAILGAPDPERAVQALAVQDLYSLVRDVGIEDSAELLSVAAPEQVQGIFDLDVWDRDQLVAERADPWLQVLLEAGPQRVGLIWEKLDPELTALLLARWTRIYDLSEEEVPDQEEPPFFVSPDRHFVVKIRTEGNAEARAAEEAAAGHATSELEAPELPDEDHVKLVERLLDNLYRVDGALARHSLRQARSEPMSFLEEASYQARVARLADLGFDDFHRALEVYQPIDVETVRPGDGTADEPRFVAHLPVPLMEAAYPVAFLGQVLRHISDAAEADRVETALLVLFNRVAAADRVNASDMEGLKHSARRAAGALSIGLETVARGDIERGVEALGSIAFVRLHRVGHSVLRKLSLLLKTLGEPARYADEPYAQVMTALRQDRPEFPEALDDPPGAGTRPFFSLNDVSRVTASLARLGQQIHYVFDVLGADRALLGPAVTVGDLGRTALLRTALGMTPPVAPVSGPEVRRFVAEHMPKGVIVGKEDVVRGAPEEHRLAVAGWLADLEERLGGIVGQKEVDPRFLGGLLYEHGS